MELSVRDTVHASTLEIRASAEDVRTASEWMTRFAQNHQVPQDQIDRLDLCLNEALANVISYGNALAHAEPVVLLMRVSQHAEGCDASVTVSDAGQEFDTAHAPVANRPHSLEDAQPGGLGLLMLRSFSDDLQYRRFNARNELTFSVRWTPSGTDSL